MHEPFAIRDCALVAIATGQRAQTLRELRDGLLRVPRESIYYHFWGRLLRPRFDDTEFHNDFAAWTRHCLHDETLAERLAVIDPADFTDLEELRHELVEVIENRLDETDVMQFARRDRQFHFRRCQTVVFDTGNRVRDPQALAQAIPAMSVGSVYYHVIDARWREPVRTDDFRTWLRQFGRKYGPLCDELAGVDPYFSNLAQLRAEIGRLVGVFIDRGAAR
ncbi:MAG: hypothetical protein AMXMBFR8_16480 [Nevskiales bacterium]